MIWLENYSFSIKQQSLTYIHHCKQCTKCTRFTYYRDVIYSVPVDFVSLTYTTVNSVQNVPDLLITEMLYTVYLLILFHLHTPLNHIGDVMVSVLASSAIDHGFKPRSGQSKNFGICCFSAKHTALRRKGKDWSLGIRKMRPSGATCLPGSEHYKNHPTKCE